MLLQGVAKLKMSSVHMLGELTLPLFHAPFVSLTHKCLHSQTSLSVTPPPSGC